MSEQDNRPLDGTSPAEEVAEENLEINLDEEMIEDEPTENVEELKAQLAKKDQAMKQILARAKAAEAKTKNINKPEPKKGRDKDDIRETVEQLRLAEQKRQFGYANKLSPEETDYLFKLSPTPSSELLNDPFIKGGLEAIRKSKRVEDNTPALGSRSPRFELPKKENMTPADKQKAFEEHMQSKFRK